jgi:hypothetical protein
MLPQPAIRTDAFRRQVPKGIAPPASSHALDGASERDALAQSMRLMGAVMSFPRN